MVEKSTCSVGATIQLIGGKYKAVILWHLMGHTLRYSELHKLIAAATDKMLAQQLRELERDGLVHREVYPVVPPKTLEVPKISCHFAHQMLVKQKGYCLIWNYE